MGAVTSSSVARSAHAPKQDRSRATRQRLLEAAVACLAEHGWAGSTVSVVAERAGVSRGAAQHHFPTREDLFTGAVEYVAEERSAALRALPVQGRAEVVAALVDLYTGPLFRAALQLWVAASNEDQLRPRVTELEARVGRETHRIAVELLAADESRPRRPRDGPGPPGHGPRPGPRQPPHRRHRPPRASGGAVGGAGGGGAG
ncbi:HTH-type transcriptional regulator BetI [Streptomyces microflavus]